MATNHAATIRRNGDAHDAAIRQFERNNTSAITHNGSDNDARLLQIGPNVNGQIVQNRDNQRQGLLQTRRGSLPIPAEMCRSYDCHHAAGFVMHPARLALLQDQRQ